MLTSSEQAELLKATCETDAAGHRLVWEKMEQTGERLEWALGALEDGLPTRTEEELELARETVRAELEAREACAEWMHLRWREALSWNEERVGAAEATDDWLAETREKREALLELLEGGLPVREEEGMTVDAPTVRAMLSVLDGLALLESDRYGGEDGEAAEAEDAQG